MELREKITYPIRDEYFASKEYKNLISHYQFEFTNNGYLLMNIESEIYKVFSAFLFVYFCSKSIQVYDTSIEKDIFISGDNLRKIYIEAYKKGIDYFIQHYSFNSLDFAIKTNSDLYILNLKSLYERDIKPLIGVRLMIVSISNIQKYGFNFSIYNEILNVKNKYPKYFENLFKESEIP